MFDYTYISIIKDSIGNRYLAVVIPKYKIDRYIEDLSSILDEDDFNLYTDNQKNRDSNKYHITVINVSDYNKLNLNESQLLDITSTPIHDLELLGIGTSKKGDNTTYYVVCNSDTIDKVRQKYGLDSAHLHITLGFDKKDVFGVSKKDVIIKNFLKF